MRAALCLALLACLAASSRANTAVDERTLNLAAEFGSFVTLYGKTYQSPEEYRLRLQVFSENLGMIQRHNADPARTYELGVNAFADMTWDEFQQTVLATSSDGYNAMQNCSATHPQPGDKPTLRGNEAPHQALLRAASPSSGPLGYPPYFDWRSYGVVTEVKAQGQCGSCWTFSSSGALEAHMALKRMRRDHQLTALELLSEQQLIDCAREYNNNGCSGGLPSQAFEYIRHAGGLNPEWAYPYEDGVQKEGGGHDIHPCRAKKLSDDVGGVVPGGSVNITQGGEDELLAAVALVGPVSIAYQVLPDFRFYKSGVYSNSTCQSGPDTVNHAVLGVGYGEHTDGTPYWVVKNSWGIQWGDGGYFKILRGANMCGVATCASYPDVYGPPSPDAKTGLGRLNALNPAPPKAAEEIATE